MNKCPKCNQEIVTFESELSKLMSDKWSWNKQTYRKDLKSIVDLFNKYKDK